MTPPTNVTTDEAYVHCPSPDFLELPVHCHNHHDRESENIGHQNQYISIKGSGLESKKCCENELGIDLMVDM